MANNDPSIHEAQSTSQRLSDNLQEFGERARDATLDTVEQVKDGVAGYVREGRQQLQRMEENVERHIRVYPLSSVLIATGVGMVLGGLVVSLANGAFRSVPRRRDWLNWR